MLYSVLVSIDVLIAAALIGLVLIQQGKGANAGAAFGGGASGTVFGARGSASFLTRATAILAALFFINSLVLAYLASHQPGSESIMESAVEVQEESVNGDDAAAVIDVLNQKLEEQTDELAKQQGEALPEDVPEFTEEKVMDGATNAVDAEINGTQQQVQEAVEDASQSLPADVPQ